MATAGDGTLISAAPSPRVRAVFAAMVASMVRWRFHAVRLARGSRDVLAAADSGARPAVVVMNHCSWWDPILLIVLSREFMPSRAPYGPIDRDELKRFAIFRKVGLFGVDPDDPRTLEAMRGYLSTVAARDPRLAFFATPQGRFADVRDEIVPRPGVAAVAAALAPDRAVSVAVEYGFWVDQKPEIFLRAEPVSCEAGGTLAWQRRFTESMRANQSALAGLVRAREADGFEPLSRRFAPKSTGTIPFYDLWLRLTGRSGGELGEARRERGAR